MRRLLSVSLSHSLTHPPAPSRTVTQPVPVSVDLWARAACGCSPESDGIREIFVFSVKLDIFTRRFGAGASAPLEPLSPVSSGETQNRQLDLLEPCWSLGDSQIRLERIGTTAAGSQAIKHGDTSPQPDSIQILTRFRTEPTAGLCNVSLVICTVMCSLFDNSAVCMWHSN